MSLKEDAIEAILNAQNSAWNTLPKLVHRAALPPIAPKTTPSMLVKGEEASRPATSVGSRPPTSSIGFPALPKLGTKPMKSISEKPQTPLYPIPRTNIGFTLNLNDIDENEVLRPESAASTVMESERELTKKILNVPKTFAGFRELSVDLDQVSSEDIMNMLQGSYSQDHHHSGFLSIATVLSSIRTIHPSDTWQNLFDWLIATGLDSDGYPELAPPSSPNISYLVDYQMFFDVLLNDKQAREVL